MFCPQDSTWGPASTCRPLDFTLFFEESILTLTPDVVFIVFVTVRLYSLFPQNNKLAKPGRILLLAKCLASLLVISSSATKLAFYFQQNKKVPVGLAAHIFQLVASLPLAVLVLAEHFRSHAPSMLILCYTAVKAIFSGAMLRTYVLVGIFQSTHNVAIASTLVTSAFFLLFCTELIEKRRLLQSKTLPTVVTSSFLSRSLYLWLLPLLWSGRNKTLTPEDYGTIPPELGASSTRLKLERALLTTSKSHPRYLFVASGKAFGFQFLAPVLPRIALLLVTFAQPLLVTKTISFVSDAKQPDNQGWLLVGGFVCVFMLISVTTSLYWEKVFDSTVAYRGALVGAIYAKTLRLSRASSSSLGGGVASTYMSVDVERVCQGLEIFHELWASVMAVFLAVVLLYFQASWPAFLPLVITIALLIMATFVGRSVNKSQATWLAATDRRVKFITSVIHNFLPMKWSTYENTLAKRAAELRSEEMEGAGRFYRGITVSASISNVASTMCTLSVLAPYSAFGILDVNRIFTIVTTVNLLSSPLSLLGQLLPDLAAAYASVRRIQGYLLLDETTDVGGNHPNEESKSEKQLVGSVSITAASFAWAPESPVPFLKNISLSLDDQFDLYMCVGPVASGKSLLLLSILNETTLMAGGFTSTCFGVAYAQQDALIVSGTIRDNITFGKPFSANRFDQVIDACGLTADIRKLKSGDGTFLGEKGTRLSGGQRQRVALARAVYANASLTLLDDPFSALDAETEAHVFQSLFGPNGLLKGKMVVLVTHNIKHLYSADHVIVMSAGEIVHQGTLTAVQEAGYTGLKDTGKTKVDSSDMAIVSKGEEHIEEHEGEEAPIAKASLGLTPYKFFGQMSGSMNIFLIPLLFTLTAVIRLGIQFYLKFWAESDGTHLPAWIGGYAGLLLLSLLALYCVFSYFSYLISGRIGQRIHAAELEGLFETSPSYAMTTPAGQIINRFSQDIFMSDFEFPVSFLNWMLGLVTLVGTVIFIMIPVPWLTISVVPLGLVYYLSMNFYLKTSKQLQHLEASSKSPMYTLFSTTVSGLVTIRALGVEDHFLKQNEDYLDISQKPFYFRFGGIRFLRTLLSLISAVLAIGLATLAIGLRHSTSPSSLGLALSSVTNLTSLLANLLLSLSSLENASISISRIHEIVNLPKETDDGAAVTPPVLSDKQDSQSSWPSRGCITFEDFHLKYRPELDYIIKGISFKIGAGQKIGICGRSGSGKSSLIMALFRALDSSLTGGKIEIDGVDIQSVSLNKLRSSFSLVAQDPFLWNAPLRHNLDPQGNYTDQDVWMALKRVRMDDAVLALPGQLESVIEDGGSLSKGQCQLICLARVLLRKRKIVVLDEASSSLDLDTDEQMRRVIETDLADCTVIAVAHRLATISNFDMVFVMEDGNIIENGSPQDLLSRPKSTFAQLALRQGLQHVEP